MNITSIWDLIYYARTSIGNLIGGPATVIMASLFSYILIRIVFSAVLSLFRGAIKYNTLKTNWKRTNQPKVNLDNVVKSLFDD